MRLPMALISLRVRAGWSEPLLVAHTTLLEISYFRPALSYSLLFCLFLSGRLGQVSPNVSILFSIKSNNDENGIETYRKVHKIEESNRNACCF